MIVLALSVLLAMGVQTFRVSFAALEPPLVYQKDVVQDWLMARAILDGTNPYIAEHDIAMRYLPSLEPYMKQHAATHPPAAAVLTIPLGLLSLEAASLAWLGVELCLLVASVVILFKALRPARLDWRLVVLATVTLLAWAPTLYELLNGQWNLALLALTTGAIAAYRRDRPMLAGVLLGLAISLKLIPAMLVLYFIARGSWKVVGLTVVTSVVSTLSSVAVLGLDAGRSFVTLGLSGASGWRASEGNYSIFGAVSHLFEGSDQTPPLLLHQPGLEWPIAIAAVLLVLVLAWRQWRRGPIDIGLALGCVLMVMASPVAWQYYLLLLCWPLLVIGRRLDKLSWPKSLRKHALLALLLLSVPAPLVLAIVAAVFVQHGTTGVGVSVATIDRATLSPLANIPLFVLAAGPLVLFALLLRLDGAAMRAASAPRAAH
jgi:hypothetical protein